MRTHSRDAFGRYIVRLPFKASASVDTIRFGDSYATAYRCLLRMESKFAKDPKLRDAYNEFMTEFENLGHMALAAKVDVRKDLSESVFSRHHGVWKESSSTTKLRTVFNG